MQQSTPQEVEEVCHECHTPFCHRQVGRVDRCGFQVPFGPAYMQQELEDLTVCGEDVVGEEHI